MRDYDLLVIGAGSGGVRCARIAAQLGQRVGVVEGRHWGGTCVNLGCVPKKLMVYAAEGAAGAEEMRAYGWDVHLGAHDWQKFMHAKDREIDRLSGLYESMLAKAGVHCLTGYARFLDSHTVEIGPGPLDLSVQSQRVTAQKIVIATGGCATRPAIEDAEHALVSDDIFRLKSRPERICIVGGGYIGVEFAGIFAGLGSEVFLVTRQALPLRGFDEELRQHLAAALPRHGIKCHASASPKKIERRDDLTLCVTLDDKTQLQVDCVFFATGRKPNIHSLGLETTKVLVKNGAVCVDEQSATDDPAIFAIGDVTDRLNLTPVALAQGHSLAQRLFADHPPRGWSYETTPKAVFFTEPLASVGLTEEEAVSRGAIDVYTASFRTLRHTLLEGDQKVFVKLVVECDTGKILGAHMMGDSSPEIMQSVAIAVTSGLTKDDFDRTIGIHPTTAEELVTMRTPTRTRQRCS